MASIYPIVEGHGDVQAVPLLLRRIAHEFCDKYDIEILSPHRVPKGRMLATNGRWLEDAVELGVRKISQRGENGAILVLLDADDDCPATLGPGILQRISRPDVAISVVIANREYEAWFLAGIVSLRGYRGISDAAVAPENFESIRGAKQYLEREFFAAGQSYQETIDQPALTAVLNIDDAKVSPSFNKFFRDACRLILEI